MYIIPDHVHCHKRLETCGVALMHFGSRHVQLGWPAGEATLLFLLFVAVSHVARGVLRFVLLFVSVRAWRVSVLTLRLLPPLIQSGSCWDSPPFVAS